MRADKRNQSRLPWALLIVPGLWLLGCPSQGELPGSGQKEGSALKQESISPPGALAGSAGAEARIEGQSTGSAGVHAARQAAGAPAARPSDGGAAPAALAAPAARADDRKALEEKARQAIDRALKWMRSQQGKDGSYGGHPGVTAMALLAFLQSHRRYRETDGPFVRGAVEYLVSLAKPNGSIFDKNLPTYNTALAILALHATENHAYRGIVKKGQGFLVGLQAAEQNNYKESDKFFGGIGYGSDERPDLSNLQFALQALVETGYDGDKAVFARALHFLERCQNRSESNDQPWAGDDGGFVYAPGESKAGGTQSYGSMTYAGLKSLMYAEVKRSDPRVQAAVKWIRAHWDLKSHPGMGDTGLYYYYHTLAKSLSVYGIQELKDDRGQVHQWSGELIRTLLARQDPEGWWVNRNQKYWEGNKLLVTARALLALEAALGLTRDAAPARPKPSRPREGAGSPAGG